MPMHRAGAVVRGAVVTGCRSLPPVSEALLCSDAVHAPVGGSEAVMWVFGNMAMREIAGCCAEQTHHTSAIGFAADSDIPRLFQPVPQKQHRRHSIVLGGVGYTSHGKENVASTPPHT